MTINKSTWYYDTSAVNWLMENISIKDALATRNFQLSKNREWKLSPVTIWEIMMTTDSTRREEILYFCQHLFHSELLPSPSELIISFIEQGMPIIEKPRHLNSKSSLSKVWKNISNDRKQFLIFDEKTLKGKTKFIQGMFKDIHLIGKNNNKITKSQDFFSGYDATLTNILNNIDFIKEDSPIKPELFLTYKISLFYILNILCAEADLDNTPVTLFWKKLGINSTIDRIIYVAHQLPTLIHRGPFMMMALMTQTQVRRKYSRGVFFDSLHSIYLTYSDHLLTNDLDFNRLKEVIPENSLSNRVIQIKDLELTQHSVNTFGLNELD